MIKCHLSRFMGEYKMNATDVARATGIHRIMIGQLYRETATRLDLRELEQLCKLFNCTVGEMLELMPDPKKQASATRARSSTEGPTISRRRSSQQSP
jgi:putative transcriptional regulator